MFDNLKTDENIAGDSDRLGGGYILESDAYNFVVDMAYMDESKGGAMSLNLSLKTQAGDLLKQTFWLTGGRAKGQNNYYIDKTTGDKHYLPGFNQANNICLLSIGKSIADVGHETKSVNVYNPELKKEAPTAKEVLTELIGAQITLGVVKQIVDKTTKNANDQYVPTGETREENEVDKAFRTKDGLTAAEIRAGATDAEFLKAWTEKNKGVTRNKAKGVAAGNASPISAASTSAAPAAGGDSLFK